AVTARAVHRRGRGGPHLTIARRGLAGQREHLVVIPALSAGCITLPPWQTRVSRRSRPAPSRPSRGVIGDLYSAPCSTPQSWRTFETLGTGLDLNRSAHHWGERSRVGYPRRSGIRAPDWVPPRVVRLRAISNARRHTRCWRRPAGPCRRPLWELAE